MRMSRVRSAARRTGRQSPLCRAATARPSHESWMSPASAAVTVAVSTDSGEKTSARAAANACGQTGQAVNASSRGSTMGLPADIA